MGLKKEILNGLEFCGSPAQYQALCALPYSRVLRLCAKVKATLERYTKADKILKQDVSFSKLKSYEEDFDKVIEKFQKAKIAVDKKASDLADGKKVYYLAMSETLNNCMKHCCKIKTHLTELSNYKGEGDIGEKIMEKGALLLILREALEEEVQMSPCETDFEVIDREGTEEKGQEEVEVEVEVEDTKPLIQEGVTR